MIKYLIVILILAVGVPKGGEAAGAPQVPKGLIDEAIEVLSRILPPLSRTNPSVDALNVGRSQLVRESKVMERHLDSGVDLEAYLDELSSSNAIRQRAAQGVVTQWAIDRSWVIGVARGENFRLTRVYKIITLPAVGGAGGRVLSFVSEDLND